MLACCKCRYPAAFLEGVASYQQDQILTGAHVAIACHVGFKKKMHTSMLCVSIPKLMPV